MVPAMRSSKRGLAAGCLPFLLACLLIVTPPVLSADCPYAECGSGYCCDGYSLCCPADHNCIKDPFYQYLAYCCPPGSSPCLSAEGTTVCIYPGDPEAYCCGQGPPYRSVYDTQVCSSSEACSITGVCTDSCPEGQAACGGACCNASECCGGSCGCQEGFSCTSDDESNLQCCLTCNGVGCCTGNCDNSLCCPEDQTNCSGVCCDHCDHGLCCPEGQTNCNGVCCENCQDGLCCGDEELNCGNSCCASDKCCDGGLTCCSSEANCCGGTVCCAAAFEQCCTSSPPSAGPALCCDQIAEVCEQDVLGVAVCDLLQDIGGGDPHFVLPTLVASNLEATRAAGVKEFAFDFHGFPNRAYCMITDSRFAVTAHMFGLPPNTTVVENNRSDEEEQPFFEGTWMDGIGFVYEDKAQKNRSIAVWLDSTADADQRLPFAVLVDGESLDLSQGPWISSDGLATVRVSEEKAATVIVAIEGLLEMGISGDFEEELVTNPPLQFLAVEIRAMSVSPNLHGFLGQMYAPHAARARLEMGTLEGFLHREYVEGSDEDYETGGLTSADCAFSTFKKADRAVDVSSAKSRRVLTVDLNPSLIRCATKSGNGGVFVCNQD